MVPYLSFDRPQRPNELCYACRGNMIEDNKSLVAHPNTDGQLIHPVHRDCAIEILQSGFHSCYCTTLIDPRSLSVNSQRRNITLLEGQRFRWDKAIVSISFLFSTCYNYVTYGVNPAAVLPTVLSGYLSGFGLAYRNGAILDLNAGLMMASGGLLATLSQNPGFFGLLTSIGIVPKILFAPDNRRIPQIAFLALSLLITLSWMGKEELDNHVTIQQTVLCYSVSVTIFYIFHRILHNRG